MVFNRFRHVVDTCCFFKSNLSLLGGSHCKSSALCTPNNSTEKSGARSWARPQYLQQPQLHQQAQQQCVHSTHSEGWPSIRPQCQCPNVKQPFLSRSSSTGGQRHPQRQAHHQLKLNAAELANIGLPSYDLKRRLVERAVEGVAGILRGDSSSALFRGLEQLLQDGLLPQRTAWEVVVAVTKPGGCWGRVQLISWGNWLTKFREYFEKF